MSLTSRTNRWASRVIIILQLATWNAVGIVLLHRGVSTLRRRILETNYVVEADPPTGLESIVSSTRRNGSEYDLSTQRQSIDKNVEIIIQIDPDGASPRSDRNLFGLGAMRDERLKDAFEIASEEQRSTLFLADPLGTPSSRLRNHLTETDRRIDDRPENNVVTSRISRVARDREHILGKGISRSVQEEEDTASILDRSGSILTKEEKEEEEKKKEENFAEEGNATRATVRETTQRTSPEQFALWTGKTGKTGKSNVRFSRVNEDSATTAVALVAIGAIMLLVGPVVVILRILDERRQARKLVALPASAREDLPPTYEQAVLMDEAPRYSTLSLNYDRTPPSSPTLSSTYAFQNVAT
ncbi:uncharacterized protein [Temnothorax longispinosus]|uniref:uncharacterized protein n=1 Tax=Temnothorax longispinosus TaxID=300112 RepID=UPI003A9A3E83